ncbi:MAG: hypothetical protein ACR2PW_07050, partial [Gammaproteobacteria bacterium]
MRFALSPSQTLLSEQIGRWAHELITLKDLHAIATAGESDRVSSFAAYRSKMAQMGLLSIVTPTNQGGLGLTGLEAALV